jgi:hypothetical protein
VREKRRVDAGIAQLKEAIYRLGLGVAGSGIVLMFTVGALFGFGFIVVGLAASIAVHPELLNPIRAYLSSGWRVVSAKNPIGMREAVLFICIATIPNIGIVSVGAIYQRHKFVAECRSITNDLTQFIADRRKGEPQTGFAQTQEGFEQQQKAIIAYESDTDALYQKEFAVRIQVACDRIRSYRFWNVGEEEFVCLNPARSSVLFRPQSIEALALELSWQDWITSRTAL